MTAPDSPASVFARFVELVGRELACEGFTSTQDHQLVRLVGEFEHRLVARTARDNVPGKIVDFDVTVQVHSPRYARWLECECPIRSTVHGLIDSCGPGQLGVQGHRAWNVADPARHVAQVEHFGALYRGFIAPHLRRFEDAEQVAESFATREGPPSALMRVQMALCFGSVEHARRAALAYRQAHPQFHAAYTAELRRLAEVGLPEAYRFDGYGEALALAEVLYELELDPLEDRA